MKLSIIIVSYNTKDLLDHCLKSIYANTKNIEVIVVDNNSIDGSVEMAEKKYPQVLIVKNKLNLGFGKANNLGAGIASGDIILFLNSDTLIKKETISKLLKFFEDNINIGVAAPKIILPTHQIQPYSYGSDPTVWSVILEKFKKPKNKIKTKRVDWVTGAALAIRREIFLALGGFDENIFMYFEDNDLCLRVRKYGFEVWVCSDAEIIHFGGMSKTTSDRQKKIYFASQDYFFKKHYGLVGLFLLRLFRLPYKIIQKLKFKN